MADPYKCEHCEEGPQEYRLTLATQQGELLDTINVCEECLKSAQVLQLLSLN